MGMDRAHDSCLMCGENELWAGTATRSSFNPSDLPGLSVGLGKIMWLDGQYCW